MPGHLLPSPLDTDQKDPLRLGLDPTTLSKTKAKPKGSLLNTSMVRVLRKSMLVHFSQYIFF